MSWLGYGQSRQEIIITSPSTEVYQVVATWTHVFSNYTFYGNVGVATSYVTTSQITSPFIVGGQTQLAGMPQYCEAANSYCLNAMFAKPNSPIVRYDAGTISVGQVQVSFTSVGGPVDFWIININQFGDWIDATSLNAALASSAIQVEVNVTSFNRAILIPSTDHYYFIFVNPNQGTVSLKFEVEYLTVPVYQLNTVYTQEMTTGVTQEAVGEAPMGFGLAFYSGLVAVVIGVAILFVDFRKSTNRGE